MCSFLSVLFSWHHLSLFCEIVKPVFLVYLLKLQLARCFLMFDAVFYSMNDSIDRK